jgi:ABC-type molybdate transport system substrate-binding protein
MKKHFVLPALAAALCSTALAPAQNRLQTTPPWSKGANDPATSRGYSFQVPDVDNVPDLHGNPADAKLVLFIGGNQFFVLPRLIAGFEEQHPELKGKIFYETLPPGILRKQIAAGNTLTLGNLTLTVQPDVYEAGARVLHDMASKGEVKDIAEYATNDLAIMVPAGNPKHIGSLKDLGRGDLKLSMPNPQWEGVANQIAAALRKAGGEPLYQAVYHTKVADGSSILTQIHHRQTPMRILQGKVDAGVTWASEVKFQEKVGNPITGVAIPDAENMTAIYAAGVLPNAPHAEAAEAWVQYLKSDKAQTAYHEFGFKSLPSQAK